MVQNRNKLIDLFIGNISNAIVHEILKIAVGEEFIVDKYRKESENSFEIACKYRSMINPTNRSLPEKDIEYIKHKIINKAKTELMLRISKGYENIDLRLIEEVTENALKIVK